MLMEVSNSGELKPTADSGIGIANTRRRLDLQFKGKAHLELLQVDANVVARLTIQK